MIQCKRCQKQYIGENERRLRDHLNEHRRPADKTTNISGKAIAVSEHFLPDNHTANDISLIH